MSDNTLCWTDIPVLDLDRAMAFYSAILDSPVMYQTGPGFEFGLLPHVDGPSGCLVKSESNHPSLTGPLIYLSVEGRLDAAVQAATEKGGQVLKAKHSIGPHGFCAMIADSEGNRIALHSHVE